MGPGDAVCDEKWTPVPCRAAIHGPQSRVHFDYNEIKALGSQTSVGRTADQTDLALFWYENSSFSWNRIARLLVAQKPMSMLEHARLFATLNAALADAYIASLDSKYVYNFWRPITAIQRGGDDGNRLTTPDLGWQPLLLTPPVPEYPSAHATAGGRLRGS